MLTETYETVFILELNPGLQIKTQISYQLNHTRSIMINIVLYIMIHQLQHEWCKFLKVDLSIFFVIRVLMYGKVTNTKKLHMLSTMFCNNHHRHTASVMKLMTANLQLPDI